MLTAGIKRVDRAAVAAAVESWARQLATRADVRRIVWYGSFITGTPTPRSDADLSVVVADGATRAPRHARAADLLPTHVTPVPFDVSVFTESEFASLADWAPNWARAIANGRVLLER